MEILQSWTKPLMWQFCSIHQPNYCECNILGDIEAISCNNAYHGLSGAVLHAANIGKWFTVMNQACSGIPQQPELPSFAKIPCMARSRRRLTTKNELIKAQWRIYASVQHTDIASDNGLSPVRRQAIIWTNAATLSIRQGIYKEYISVKFHLRFKSFHSRKCTWKCRLRSGVHFISASVC